MILLVSPPAPARLHGNDMTARRWMDLLRSLGHEVHLASEYVAGDYTALVALHARKSAQAVHDFRTRHPDASIVLALTGTDLYPDPATTGVDPAVLAAASRIVVLQEHALRQLDSEQRERARVIVQSAPPIERQPPRAGMFEVAVLAHLRQVKDPLRAAEAARLLPAESRVRITHVGAALEDELQRAASAEAHDNPRYDWHGEVPRAEALAVLARSRLLLLTSRDEGGANVVSEALAAGVPVVSTAIPGSRGLLGDDYPGCFPIGDTAALAELLHAAETDRDGRYTQLVRRCAHLHELVDPARERRAWADLLHELSLPVTA